MNARRKVGLGELKLPLTGRHFFTVVGGPYREKPNTYVGVKMAKEIKAEAQVSIPTDDFSTPPLKVLDAGLEQAVTLLLAGEPLYVGCMGGRGRTGLFLAILAKVLDVKGPVEYVRKEYYGHAVETDEQYAFVTEYEAPAAVTKMIRKARRQAQWYFWSKPFWANQLTREPAGLPTKVIF